LDSGRGAAEWDSVCGVWTSEKHSSMKAVNWTDMACRLRALVAGMNRPRDWHLATLSCCGTGRSLADWPLPSAATTSLTSVSTQLRCYSPTCSQFFDVHSHPLAFAGCTEVQSNSSV